MSYRQPVTHPTSTVRDTATHKTSKSEGYKSHCVDDKLDQKANNGRNRQQQYFDCGFRHVLDVLRVAERSHRRVEALADEQKQRRKHEIHN